MECVRAHVCCNVMCVCGMHMKLESISDNDKCFSTSCLQYASLLLDSFDRGLALVVSGDTPTPLVCWTHFKGP